MAFEQLVDNLQQSIEMEETVISGLQTFLSEMQQLPDAFDHDDKDMVTEALQQHSAQLNMLQQEMRQRHHTYEHQVLKMERSLDERMKVIDNLDPGVIDANSELFEKLAEKQAHLSKLLTDMKERLSAPVVSAVHQR